MSLEVPKNVREPFSRITDASILRPRDELQLIGREFLATIGVLDSHNPSARYGGFDLGQVLGIEYAPLPNHHHILVRIDDQSEVISTGMYVDVGNPVDLIFKHIARRQVDGHDFRERQKQMHEILNSGDFGLYFISDQEQLSRTPEGQQYLNPNGGLLI